MGWDITDSKALEDAVLELRFDLARKIGVSRGMTVVDMGCGQGGFTVSLARIVGKQGKVLAVDISDEYLAEFMENLRKWNGKNIVTFVQADASNLRSVVPNEFADMSVSYRFLEELKHPRKMGIIVKEMARIVKKGGKIYIIELSTEAKNEAEENYIRLHRESGDSFFKPNEILEAMKEATLKKLWVETFETDIWFSPELAKQELSLAQVWFTSNEEKRLGPNINRYGMKYPPLLIFSGVK
jgi:SAM-dependent methyltransferase